MGHFVLTARTAHRITPLHSTSAPLLWCVEGRERRRGDLWKQRKVRCTKMGIANPRLLLCMLNFTGMSFVKCRSAVRRRICFAVRIFLVLAHSLDRLQAHQSLVSAWLLNEMPGEDRQRGTRSAPSADNNGNGQSNKNTTDTAKAKTSSEEGEVRAILVSALSEKSDRALGPCDSSDDARFTCSFHSATPPTLPTWRTTRNL
jgi:hypothetical protein